MAKPVAEDQLLYVRERFEKIPTSQYDEIAEKSGVSKRTLFHIRREDSKPLYETVRSVYAYLKASENAKRAARPK